MSVSTNGMRAVPHRPALGEGGMDVACMSVLRGGRTVSRGVLC